MNPPDYAGASDLGRVRSENQDRWFADPERGVFLVADGMGGSRAGGLAAEAVVEVLPKLLRRELNGAVRLDDPATKQAVLDALAQVSDQLHAQGRKNVGTAGLGSTAVLAILRGPDLLVAHMGDSRAYLLHRRRLQRLTKDHSLAQILIDNGELDGKQAQKHPARSQLTRYVGMRGEALPEAGVVRVRPGDRLLLCTDGLYGMLDADRLTAILRQSETAEQACQELIAEANSVGGEDNITAVVISVPEETKA